MTLSFGSMDLFRSAANAFVGLGARFEGAMERGLKSLVVGYELLASSKDVDGDSLVIDELAPAMVGLDALRLGHLA